MALSRCLFTCVCACGGSWLVGDELQTQMVGISRPAGGRLAALHVWAAPLPLPLSPRGLPVCNSTRFGKPYVLMEADHGLISSHSTISGPSWLGAPREKGAGVSAGDVCMKTALFWKGNAVAFKSGTDFVIRSHFKPLNGALSKCILICTFIARRVGGKPSLFSY